MRQNVLRASVFIVICIVLAMTFCSTLYSEPIYPVAGSNYLQAEIVPECSIGDDTLWEQCEEEGEVTRFEYQTNYYSGDIGHPFRKTMTVYTPYGYSTNSKYNVLILITGMNMPDSCYMKRAHEYDHKNYHVSMKDLVDNMIYRKMINPMIICTVDYTGCSDILHPVLQLDGMQVAKELRNDILPYIIENYSTYAKDSSSESISEAREHFGVYGHSYGATITIKYLLSLNADLFYWFGANAVFNTDITHTKELINSGDYEVFCYCGAGETDEARPQTEGIYRQLTTECSPSIRDGENAFYVVVPEAGHNEKAFDTALYNCIRMFFRNSN